MKKITHKEYVKSVLITFLFLFINSVILIESNYDLVTIICSILHLLFLLFILFQGWKRCRVVGWPSVLAILPVTNIIIIIIFLFKGD